MRRAIPQLLGVVRWLGTFLGTSLGPVGGDGAGMDDVGLAEYATVGSLMLAPAGVDRVAEWLRAEDFRDPLSREVFGLLVAMRDRSLVIDPVTVLGELRRRGRPGGDGVAAMTLIRMVEAVPVPGAVAAYGRLVLAASIGRQLEAAGTRLAQVGRGRRGGSRATGWTGPPSSWPRSRRPGSAGTPRPARCRKAVNGQTYARSIFHGLSECNPGDGKGYSVEYDLGRKYLSFTAIAGLSDVDTHGPRTVQFRIDTDGGHDYSTSARGESHKITFDIAGTLFLRLTVYEKNGSRPCITDTVAVWGDAQVRR
jgi:hypothetical protein